MIDTKTGEVFEVQMLGSGPDQGIGSLSRVAKFNRAPMDSGLFYNEKNWIYKAENNRYYLWSPQ